MRNASRATTSFTTTTSAEAFVQEDVSLSAQNVNDEDGIGMGVVIGAVAGGLAVLGLCLGFAIRKLRQSKYKDLKESESQEPSRPAGMQEPDVFDEQREMRMAAQASTHLSEYLVEVRPQEVVVAVDDTPRAGARTPPGPSESGTPRSARAGDIPDEGFGTVNLPPSHAPLPSVPSTTIGTVNLLPGGAAPAASHEAPEATALDAALRTASEAPAPAPPQAWEVETDDGWFPWTPGGGVTFIGEAGETVEFTSRGFPYKAYFESNRFGVQTNLRTGKKRRLRNAAKEETDGTWEVQTDTGWADWVPGVPFNGSPGERINYTLGKFEYLAVFEVNGSGTQTNLRTQKQRRLRYKKRALRLL